jgi:predicted double-glycine peptidase
MRLTVAATLALFLAQPAAAEAPAPVRSILELRRDKVVIQQFDLSCGAAALATLLRYQHGDPVTEREVAVGLISRNEYIANPELVILQQGFSLLDMKSFAERRGFVGEGLAGLEFSDLLERGPAIVPLRLNGYNHFVVFRGAMHNTVLLADPAYGNRTMSLEKFLASWIDYAGLGRVAFTVRRADGSAPPSQLSVTAADFLVLH